jgi:hypothetical protein
MTPISGMAFHGFFVRGRPLELEDRLLSGVARGDFPAFCVWKVVARQGLACSAKVAALQPAFCAAMLPSLAQASL